MKTIYYTFASILLLTVVKIRARICGRNEFKCFWDGNCIPLDMKCDGRHDCAGGEDETNWLANCNHCKGQFHCHKTADYTECIDLGKTCDGYPHCFNEEDETYEFTKCKKKCKRDSVAALLAGRPKCRKICTKNKECAPPEKMCICDHECGMSCVAVEKTCEPLQAIPNLESIRYVFRDRKTKVVRDAMPPYKYGIEAHHKCSPGYIALPNGVRLCHGRENDWTREIICSPACYKKDPDLVSQYKLICGLHCLTDADCAAGKTCTCDGPCGRSCVNLEIECGDAPPAKNAILEYTGEKFERVAHYICNEGTYAAGGDISRKCTGGGKWDGIPIVCEDVTCGDPIPSITLMRGFVKNYSPPPYLFNTSLHFKCAPDQRLLGSATRTCQANGRWSGVDTVCDDIGEDKRCPHPGIPINGELVGIKSNEDFTVGKIVKFVCKEGYVMLGDAVQECLYFKQWSDYGAPSCIDPRYSDIPSDVINKLSKSTANIIAPPSRSNAGRTIFTKTAGRNEVYFLIDLSLSVGPGPLKNTMSFAKSLVKRLNTSESEGKVSYGIIVFATKPEVQLGILNDSNSDNVVKKLEEIEKNVLLIRDRIKQGTDIQRALDLLDRTQLANSWIQDEEKIVKRHVFILTDGRHNAGGQPFNARRRIELSYAENPPEFYSITSSARENDPEAHEELQSLASTEKNFIYVEDFYKLHKYIDQVTDARDDYSPCGQAGDVGSVRKLASRGRVAGGTKAESRAWPWQILIHKFDEQIVRSFDDVLGGGSLINAEWVLTATHIFRDVDDGSLDWEKKLVISMGLSRRPARYYSLEGSVAMFEPERIYKHNDYVKYVYDYDVALIKLGGQYSSDGRKIEVPAIWPGNVTFTPYIRPVCLPCSPDSCVAKVLRKPDSTGTVIITGEETPEEQCRKEYEYLMGKDEGTDAAAIVTGFGHNATRLDSDETTTTITDDLQQGLLKILDRERCHKGVDLINDQKDLGGEGFKHLFTDRMFCAESGGAVKGKITDSCQGDSGGPVVREVRDDTTGESCFVQIGIVSWGYGCADTAIVDHKEFKYPGYYADVTNLMSWITSTMDNHGN